MVVRQNACRLSAECNHKILKSFVEAIEVLGDYYLASSIRFLHPYDVYQVVEKKTSIQDSWLFLVEICTFHSCCCRG